MQSDYNCGPALFWGKIVGKYTFIYRCVLGTVKDYYIVLAFDYNRLQNGFPHK